MKPHISERILERMLRDMPRVVRTKFISHATDAHSWTLMITKLPERYKDIPNEIKSKISAAFATIAYEQGYVFKTACRETSHLKEARLFLLAIVWRETEKAKIDVSGKELAKINEIEYATLKKYYNYYKKHEQEIWKRYEEYISYRPSPEILERWGVRWAVPTKRIKHTVEK